MSRELLPIGTGFDTLRKVIDSTGIPMARKKVDFEKVLTTLKKKGFSDYQIAEETGLDRTMIYRLRTGKRKEPNYNDGASIVDMHEQET